MRRKCKILFLLSFVKVVLNQYPLLLDLSIIQFTFLVLNYRFVLSKVKGLIIIVHFLFFSILSTIFMWCTWLARFSGNANFFYF